MVTAGSELILHTKAYILADKYIIPGLKALAMNKFKAAAQQHWCARHFLLAVEEAYTYTIDGQKGIRDVIIQTFDKHEELLRDNAAQKVVKRMDSLAYDILMYRHRGPKLEWTWSS